MRRVLPLLVCLAVFTVSSSCGKSTPTAPSETRVISLSGDMNFGNVEVGQSADRTLRVTNTGNAVLTVNNISGAAGEALNMLSTSLVSATPIQPGATIDVLIRFAPAEARYYAVIGNVNGDMTSGTNGFTVTGFGVAPGSL